MIFRLGEIFCGPGGIALGAQSARINVDSEEFAITHEWANDFDRDTCDTYRSNIAPKSPDSVICKDVRRLEINSLRPIDAFAFGFPCNDFSIVGEQKGIDGIYGPLYTYGIKILKRLQPKWFLAENVGGLRNSNEGNTFQLILREMQDAGYVVTPHLYKFEEYEVPQARHRIIIIGIRNDIRVEYKVPVISNPRIITSKEAIENPPIPVPSANHEFTNQSRRVVQRLRYIKPGENAFTADIPEELRLNIKGAQISQIYKRLDPQKPAYTITGSGGGGTHVYHWSENRALTNRERARLQTFPDDFIFKGKKESVRKQIGMAVPPKASKIICEAVLKSFAGIEYEHIRPNIGIESPSLFPIKNSDLDFNLRK